jgi:uncharacterized membrane-anchored protein
MSENMKLPKRTMWAMLALVALMQTAVLAYGVYARDQLLKNGREVVMQVTPVDPRDIFRGDYVILGFPMSPITYSIAKDGVLPLGLAQGAPVFVTMSAGPENTWTVAKVSDSYPKDSPAADVVFKGRVERIDGGVDAQTKLITARFGVESYFVPEGTGKVLEQQVRDDKIQAILAVGPDGTAATKGLIVGGERRIDPPLF